MLAKLLLVAISAAGAYFGARRLIDHPAFIDDLPEPAREPVHELRDRLVDLDAIFREVAADISSERRRAEEQLRGEYMDRVRRRDEDSAPDGGEGFDEPLAPNPPAP